MTLARIRRKALPMTAALAATALGPAACGNDVTHAAGGSGGRTTVTSIAGQQIDLPATREPSAVFFFTSGCGECAGGARSLGEAAAAAQKSGAKAQFLAVDLDPGESKQTIQAFMDYVKAGQLPVVVDTGAALSQRYGVAALSTLIVIDAGGKVTFRATDPDAKTITNELEKAGV